MSKGQKIALVGINGSGKSTLLKIIAGLDQPDTGKVVMRKGLRVGYLEQVPPIEAHKTVGDVVFSESDPVIELIRRYEQALATNHPSISDLVQELEDQKAWDYENRIHAVLSRLGIPEPDRPVSSLSGGQLRRLDFAKLLVQEPDLYLLDEPTNHLDIETIEWLESLLSDKTLLMVTHDRYFLDQVANEIVELDRASLFTYKGKYHYYLEKKAEMELNREAESSKAQNLMRKELEWMRRQPKARTTKSKSRIEAFYDLEERASSGPKKQDLELSIRTSRQGNKILEMHRAGKSYGDKTIIQPFTYVFKKGDRIGLVGRNGSGKTTFLNLLTGALEPDKGKIITGETTVFGYYTQEGLRFKEDQKVIDVVKEVADHIITEKGHTISASQLLTLFLFPPPAQYSPVSKLSGGEKKRLHLLRVLIKNPNFLILDEPTNDLDILTLNILQDFLANYGGCLVLVSHDRYFIDTLVEQVFAFQDDGSIRVFPGNYTEYRLEVEKEKSREQLEKKGKSSVAPILEQPVSKKKLSYKEQKEYEELEGQIAALETKKQTLIEELGSTSDHLTLADLSKKIELLDEEINAKTFRWLELAELL